jgi:hypothetical protein
MRIEQDLIIEGDMTHSAMCPLPYHDAAHPEQAAMVEAGLSRGIDAVNSIPLPHPAPTRLSVVV